MTGYTVTIYRFAAIGAGIGWAICVLATIVNGQSVFQFLQFISTEQFDYHPMLDYWMKMAGLAFTFIGLGFLYCGIRWKEALPYGIYFGAYQIVSALGVVISMSRLPVANQMFLLDCAFFLGTGIPMTWAWWRIRQSEHAAKRSQ